MDVNPSGPPHRRELNGTTYHFCSAGCRDKFAAAPERYLRAAPGFPVRPDLGDLPEPVRGAVWTCPMHPDIRRPGPGSCPICGMAREPMEPTLEDGPNPELASMSRRFRAGAALSAPLLVLAMGTELLGWHLLEMRTFIWVQLALSTPVVLWGGWPFFHR